MKEVVKGFLDNNKLLGLLLFAGLLLALCVTVDYASNVAINNINDSLMQINDSEIIIVNNDSVVGLNEKDSIIVPSVKDKIYIDKSKTNEEVKKQKAKPKKKRSVPTVTITSKPSCGCNYGYYWHTNTFIDYCPNCHRYNTLVNKHKWPARFEQELTCKYCDCDWCGCCGKMKYSWSHAYLRKC